MEKQPAPLHEQQAALDELQPQVQSLEDQLTLQEWQQELDQQGSTAEQSAQAPHENILIGQRDTDTLPPAEKSETQTEDLLEELPDFIKETVVVGGKAEKNTSSLQEAIKREYSAEQLDNRLRGLIESYRDAKAAGASKENTEVVAKKINTVFDALAKRQGWDDEETISKQSMVFTEMGRKPEAQNQTTASPENNEVRQELSAKEMDTVLRSLVKSYRKVSKDGDPGELEDYRTKISSAFDALKTKDGWSEEETSDRREKLRVLMGDKLAFNLPTDPESTAVYEKIDAEAARGDVEELFAIDAKGKLLSKQETVDAVVTSLGGSKVPELKSDAELAEKPESDATNSDVLQMRQEDMWEEADKTWSQRVRNWFGSRRSRKPRSLPVQPATSTPARSKPETVTTTPSGVRMRGVERAGQTPQQVRAEQDDRQDKVA